MAGQNSHYDIYCHQYNVTIYYQIEAVLTIHYLV